MSAVSVSLCLISVNLELFSHNPWFLRGALWYCSSSHSKQPACILSAHALQTRVDDLLSYVSVSDLLMTDCTICFSFVSAGIHRFSASLTQNKVGKKAGMSVMFTSCPLSSLCSLQSSTHPHGGGEEGAVVRELPHRAALPGHRRHHDRECKLRPHR